ncbi:MAG: dTMP kinase [Anaerolineales bacterium]|nr:dTMP kinase [Anaerolineales bacterium]
MEKNTGKFITFEGPEGSGKSTHIKKLAYFLAIQGIEIMITREPGGTPLGERIRNLIQHSNEGEEPVDRTELLLFLASRAQHVQEVINPALKAGSWVLCDRFYDSTLAYQGYGRGFDLDELKALNDFAVNGMKPDLTLVIDVSPETSRTRLAKRHSSPSSSPDRIEAEEDAFHRRLRDGFLTLAEAEKERFYVVNAEREQGVVEQDICEFVKQRFF